MDKLLTRYNKAVEMFMAVTGLLAAFIISLNLGDQWVLLALCMFTTKDALFIAFTKYHGFNSLMWGSVGYLIIDLVGIYRWM